MDAKLVAQCRSPTLITSPHGKPKYPCVVAVLARPADDISAQPTKTNVYKDSFFDHMATNHMSKCLQETTGNCSSIHKKFVIFFIFLLLFS